MITADTLKMLYGMNKWALGVNTEGIGHEESLAAPPRGGNCANWVVGHIVATRNVVLSLVGAEAVLDKETAALYERGSAPMTDPTRARRFEELLADFERAQARLEAALDRASDQLLAAPVPEGAPKVGDGLVGSTLAMLQFHEAYHVGQTGLLRRLAGKPGAIG